MRRISLLLTSLLVVMVLFTATFSVTASAHSSKPESCGYTRAAGPVSIYDNNSHYVGYVVLWNYTCNNQAHSQVVAVNGARPSEATISGSGNPGYAQSTTIQPDGSIDTPTIPFVRPISAYGYVSYNGNTWGAQAGVN